MLPGAASDADSRNPGFVAGLEEKLEAAVIDPPGAVYLLSRQMPPFDMHEDIQGSGMEYFRNLVNGQSWLTHGNSFYVRCGFHDRCRLTQLNDPPGTLQAGCIARAGGQLLLALLCYIYILQLPALLAGPGR